MLKVITTDLTEYHKYRKIRTRLLVRLSKLHRKISATKRKLERYLSDSQYKRLNKHIRTGQVLPRFRKLSPAGKYWLQRLNTLNDTRLAYQRVIDRCDRIMSQYDTEPRRPQFTVLAGGAESEGARLLRANMRAFDRRCKRLAEGRRNGVRRGVKLR